VRAANDGTVSFAGDVAGSLHVVVAHEGGIRTSYSFLASAEVHAGEHVVRGQLIGRAGGSGDGHGAGVVHFGARVGDRYVDPTLLFRPRDLTQMVRLVPTDELEAAGHPDPSAEQRELATVAGEEDGHCAGGIGDLPGVGAVADSVCDAVTDAVEYAWSQLRALGGDVAELVDRVEPIVTAVINRMRETGEDLAAAAVAVAGDLAGAVTTLVRRAVAFAEQVYEKLTSCPQPPPVAHSRGSGNHVVAVGGLDSSRRELPDGTVTPSFHLEAATLGYHRGDVTWFSYRSASTTYSAADTAGDLHEKARLLGRQLQDVAREHRGQRVDLVAHSQGGVVVDLFLTEIYRGHEDEYPEIENVVTFASPHEGTPLANLAHSVSRSRGLRAAVETFSNSPIGATSLAQLQEGSATTKEVANGRYPHGLRFLSIAGSEDPDVPSSSADPPVGSKVVVPIGSTFSLHDHTAILRDADALSAAQAHLSGGHPAATCGLLVDAQGTVETMTVRVAALVTAMSELSAIPADA
jgi:hypothetical protein